MLQVPLLSARVTVSFWNCAYEMHSWHGLHWFSWAIPACPLLEQAALHAALADFCCSVDLPEPAVPFTLPTLEIKVSDFTDHFTQLLSVAITRFFVTGQYLCPNQDNLLREPQLCKAFPHYSLSLLTKGTSVESWGLICSVCPSGRVSHRCSLWQWCQFFGTKTNHKRATSNPKTNNPQKLPREGKGKKSNLYNSTQFLANINAQSLILPKIKYFKNAF